MLPLLLAAALLAGGDPRTHYDVHAYRLELAVDPVEETLAGAVTVEADVVVDALASLQLDLVDGLDVAAVLAGEKPLAFEHADDRLVVTLDPPAARGDRVAVTVRYSGSPQPRDGFSGFHWAETADGRPWINTSCQGLGAHSWWPCKASYWHPEDKPAEVSMDLTVPRGLVGVSNGRLEGVAEHEDGRRTYRWRHPYPLETYSVTLNVAPYVQVTSSIVVPGLEQPVPYHYWVLEENVEKAALQFEQVPELIAVYSEAFGPFPFPDSKIGLVETNFWGMEHSTAIAYGSSFPAWCEANDAPDRYAGRNRFFDYILVHEMAHEWWGNAVSAEAWGDFWIHEGFGTYAEAVYVERTQGRERADELVRGFGRRLGATSRVYRGEDVDSGDAYASEIYYKGAAVLHLLRHQLDDDEAWWRALEEFNLRHRYGNASTEDFRAVLEEVSGRDWSRFFEQWIYGEGQPRVTGNLTVVGDTLRLRLLNEGTGDTDFDVPVDLRWTEAGEPRARRVLAPPGPSSYEIEGEGPIADAEVVHLDRVPGRHGIVVW